MRASRIALVVVLLGGAVAHADPETVPDPYAYAPLVETAAAACRDHATGLRREASECRAQIAAGNTCTVTESNGFTGQQREYTSDEADARAQFYDDHALGLDAHVVDVRLMEDRINLVRESIQGLGFDRRAEEFDELARLATDHAEAYEKLKFDAGKAVFVSALSAAGAAKLPALSKTSANRMIDKLRDQRFFSPEIERSIRRISVATGKKRAKAWVDWIELAKRTSDLPEFEEKGLAALYTVFSWGLKDPKLQFLADEVELAARAVVLARDGSLNAMAIDQLSALTDVELRQLKLWSDLMVQYVSALRTELESLRACPQL